MKSQTHNNSRELAPRPSPLGHIIGRTKDGYVVFDRTYSHAHTTGALLAEALRRVSLLGRPFTKECVDFGHEIGTSDCVATMADDKIVFAQCPGRNGPTRFVEHRKPESCSSMILLLKRGAENGAAYVLITAFIGSAAEPEPWDRHATAAAREFWSRHALVWGTCPVIPGTRTEVCPW